LTATYPLYVTPVSELVGEIGEEKFDEAITKEQCIEEGKLCLGMTANDVIMAWDNPCEIIQLTSIGLQERWIYKNHRGCGYTKYLYFENGILTMEWQQASD